MRALTLAMTCALSLAACGIQTIELVDVGPRDAAPFEDAQAEDTGVVAQDSGAPDLGTRDAEPEDLGGGLDAEPDDLGTPDTGQECVCRYVGCRDTPQCEARFGTGIACDVNFACSRFVGTCSTTAECGVDLTCTAGPDSVDPCP